MIDRRLKDGLHLHHHKDIDARVVEYRIGWWSRLMVLLTGKVSVWV